MGLESFINRAWYQGQRWLLILLPLAWLFSRLARRRRTKQQAQAQPLSVPVVVVGNISLGGTGKTPLLITLLKRLCDAGFSPGVVSRGYGSQAPHYPYLIMAGDSAATAGDEPLLIAQETGCPVVLDADRQTAARYLLDHTDCDVILSDDGLQHYRLWRDLEICLIDGTRGVGNGYCLPAGPLREPVQRLEQVDWVVINSQSETSLSLGALKRPSVPMKIQPATWVELISERQIPVVSSPTFTQPLAISGIGNPQRFFTTLRELGIASEQRVFSDHHAYQPNDLQGEEGRSILMTSKDAVKCREFAQPDWWSLQVQAAVPDQFVTELCAEIRVLQSNYRQSVQ